jgi:hypothetical protein
MLIAAARSRRRFAKSSGLDAVSIMLSERASCMRPSSRALRSKRTPTIAIMCCKGTSWPATFQNFKYNCVAGDYCHGILSYSQTSDIDAEISSVVETVSGVPEPATWALFIIGFGGIGAMLRRQR